MSSTDVAPPLAPDDPRVVRPPFRVLVETFDVATVVFDAAGIITYVTPSAADFAGLTAEASLGANIMEYVPADQLEYVAESLAFALANPERTRHPIEVYFDSTGRFVEVQGLSLDEDDDIRGTAILLRDITLERMLEDILDAVMHGDDLARTLALVGELGRAELRGSAVSIRYRGTGDDPGGSMLLDVPGSLVTFADLSDPIGALADHTEDLAGIVTERVVDLPAPLCDEAAAAGFAGRWRAPLVAADGRRLGELSVWTAAATPPSPSEQDGVLLIARSAAFAVDRWQRDRQLEYAATHDGLTGLANRAVFERVLEDAQRDGADDAGRHDVVLYIDLDGFKAVNDHHGHLAGDHVLVTVSSRLRDVVRGGDLLARLGGDEFAVLLRDRGEDATIAVAERLINALSRPINMGDRRLVIGASVGIARHRPERADGAAWLNAADAALRRAKASGKHRWCRA